MILDGINIFKFDGFQPGDVQNLDSVLFNSTQLLMTEHQLEIINTSSNPDQSVLDINRVMVLYVHISMMLTAPYLDRLPVQCIRLIQRKRWRFTVSME